MRFDPRLPTRTDADANVLDLAADALTDAHREPRLALDVRRARCEPGQRRIPREPLITLARAQRAAGRSAEAQRRGSAQALKLLEAHPKSLGNSEQAAQARRLM
jgi:hypothetical protein